MRLEDHLERGAKVCGEEMIGEVSVHARKD